MSLIKAIRENSTIRNIVLRFLRNYFLFIGIDKTRADIIGDIFRNSSYFDALFFAILLEVLQQMDRNRKAKQ
jgi:hypothetical protein